MTPCKRVDLLDFLCVEYVFSVTDGAHHVVDSSELAFRLCTINAIHSGQ